VIDGNLQQCGLKVSSKAVCNCSGRSVMISDMQPFQQDFLATAMCNNAERKDTGSSSSSSATKETSSKLQHHQQMRISLQCMHIARILCWYCTAKLTCLPLLHGHSQNVNGAAPAAVMGLKQAYMLQGPHALWPRTCQVAALCCCAHLQPCRSLASCFQKGFKACLALCH